MKSHAQVVVIGGGVVGCSVLYHLTKLGWSDVMLVERSELTSGSTWHAAGGMHTLNSDPNVAKLQDYTIQLYKEIEAISGQSCGIHLSGGYMMADTAERLDWLKTARAKARYLGLEAEFVDLSEVAARHPLIDTRHFVGALHEPNEGHIDPSGVTNAYARAARIAGAEVVRHNRVTGLTQTASGWRVHTEQGDIDAEIVVNAGGLWAREIGRMAGLELPVLAMQHQYLITEPLTEIEALDGELPHIIDFAGEIYTRQEGKGFLLGTYEKHGVPWSPHTTPWEFGHELLPSDLERIAARMDTAFTHFPALATVGIKQVINGPFTFAPDGNPLIGPVRGLPGFFVACGVMAGFSQGGGVGLSLANWIVHGDPGMDVFAMDVARFGDWATRSYTNAKVRENYGRRFSITFPNEELPAGRPQRTTPVYDRLKACNAVFGASYGLEHALWYAPAGTEPIETPSLRRSNAFVPVGAECRAVRNAVGLIEIATYAKYEVVGPAAERWLNTLLANRMPPVGRMCLAPALDAKGHLKGDFTVSRLAEDRFFIVGSGIAENDHLRWFEQHLPAAGVSVNAVSADVPGLAIAGPNARALLAQLTDEDVSNEALRFFEVRRMAIGLVPATVARVSFTGELGYEIYVRSNYQLALYEALLAAGRDLGLVHFGARALNALRLEKSYGAWTREYRPDYTPFEAGLARFVDLDKDTFIGRDAVLAMATREPQRRLITLQVDAGDADAVGDEPVYHGDKVVGWVTSGGYGHCAGASLALAYVPANMAGETHFQVEILGELRPAARAERPLIDPAGARMRS